MLETSPSQPETNSRTTKRDKLIVLVSFVVFLVAGLVSAIIITNLLPKSTARTATEQPAQRTDRSDGFSITVPETFVQIPSTYASTDASYAKGYGGREQYVTVIKENISDFDEAYTASDYAKLCYEQMSDGESIAKFNHTDLANNVIANPRKYEVSDHKVEATIDGVKIVYLLRYIKTSTNFYQILTWTLPSRYSDNEAVLKAIISSFDESKNNPNQT